MIPTLLSVSGEAAESKLWIGPAIAPHPKSFSGSGNTVFHLLKNNYIA